MLPDGAMLIRADCGPNTVSSQSRVPHSDGGRTPGGANSTIAAPRGPWTPYADPTDTIHYPVRRHTNTFNVLYCDAHTSALTQADLSTPLFYAYGP